MRTTDVKPPLLIILFGLFIGLAAGNFVFQVFTNQNWMVAFDRSFFQFVALFSVWIVNLLDNT